MFNRREHYLPSSDINKAVWLGVEPDDLLHKGYSEPIDTSPQPSQPAAEGQTTNRASSEPEFSAPTAVSFYDNVVSRLRVPESPPDIRNWVTFYALQEWEGYVLRRDGENFIARLRDLTAAQHTGDISDLPEEEATIELSDVPDKELSRLGPGTVFRWVIGYERARSGTKKRVSQILLRDLPSITQEDKEDGSEWAESVLQLFKE